MKNKSVKIPMLINGRVYKEVEFNEVIPEYYREYISVDEETTEEVIFKRAEYVGLMVGKRITRIYFVAETTKTVLEAALLPGV